MQQIAAGFEIYSALLNSYNLSGAFAVSDRHHKDETSDAKAIREELLSNSEFGTLRDAKELSSITGMGIDAVAGVRWAKAIQDQLCANGKDSKQNRPDTVLVKGICISENPPEKKSVDDVLKQAELALNGGLIDVIYNKDLRSQFTTQVKPSAILQGSVKDVRSLGLKFDACGRITKATDTTLGGLYPNKDANFVIASRRGECFP